MAHRSNRSSVKCACTPFQTLLPSHPFGGLLVRSASRVTSRGILADDRPGASLAPAVISLAPGSFPVMSPSNDPRLSVFWRTTVVLKRTSSSEDPPTSPVVRSAARTVSSRQLLHPLLRVKSGSYSLRRRAVRRLPIATPEIARIRWNASPELHHQ